MTTWVVFCTAQISNETLETFLDHSINRSRYAPKNPSPWILQQTPDDEVDGPRLSSPVPTFTTGFTNASQSMLRTFLAEKVKDKLSFPNFQGDISDYSFIVLDERSIIDSTCEVHYRYDYMPKGEKEVEKYDDAVAIKEWKVWRVKFQMAWVMLAGLWHSPDLMFEFFENGRDAYVDEKGVAQLAYVEQDKYEFPDLEDEDRAPFGPGPGRK